MRLYYLQERDTMKVTLEMLKDAGVTVECCRCESPNVDLDDMSDDGHFLCGDCCEEIDRVIASRGAGREFPSWDCGR